jgi:hypothetical protein
LQKKSCLSAKYLFMQVNEYDYQSLDALFGDYKARAQKILNEEIDLKKLSEIAQKPIDTLTADDLAIIGCKMQSDEEFAEFYSIENFDHLKLYLTKEDGQYNLRGYLLRLIKPITTTPELIEEVLIKWKLKMR